MACLPFETPVNLIRVPEFYSWFCTPISAPHQSTTREVAGDGSRTVAFLKPWKTQIDFATPGHVEIETIDGTSLKLKKREKQEKEKEEKKRQKKKKWGGVGRDSQSHTTTDGH